jgi:cell wall-associated NlpC family hydrolase
MSSLTDQLMDLQASSADKYAGLGHLPSLPKPAAPMTTMPTAPAPAAQPQSNGLMQMLPILAQQQKNAAFNQRAGVAEHWAKNPGMGEKGMVGAAKTQLGNPYVFGDLDPVGGGSAGIDCSGLTKYAASKLGIDLPHSAAEQSKVVQHVAPQQMQRGDLIFYNYGRLGPGVADHVAIYTGHGQIAASSSAGIVTHQPVDWDHVMYGGRL